MKLPRMGLDNSAKGSVELPQQFSEQVRQDLIKRAVDAVRSRQRHNYGAHFGAGLRPSAKLSRRRRDFKTSYGHGISRVPRKSLSRRGTRFYWVGAVAPGTVKGRRAHPPKSSKIWEQKINIKENRKAIRSAMAATIIKEMVTLRGHTVPSGYPFIIDGSVESLSKTSEFHAVLTKLGFEKELERGEQKTVRAGKGKMRGRRYKTKRSLLIVVSEDCKLVKTASNIPGIEIARVHELNAELLAPGASPGRATLWSDKAIEKISKEKMFM